MPYSSVSRRIGKEVPAGREQRWNGSTIDGGDLVAMLAPKLLSTVARIIEGATSTSSWTLFECRRESGMGRGKIAHPLGRQAHQARSRSCRW